MTKKIFTACVFHETNTFSPLTGTKDDFADRCLTTNLDFANLKKVDYNGSPLMVFDQLAAKEGWECKHSLCAIAEPGGLIGQDIYEEFRNQIIQDLTTEVTNSKIDAILLNLHGAMAAGGYDNCEDDLVRAIRNVVGDKIPIGIELDLHANISDFLVENTTAIISYKEYPHTDIAERAEELFNLIAQVVKGQIKPVISAIDCHMIGLFPTDSGKMKDFMDMVKKTEQSDEEILSISVVHGFPWADTKNIGTKILVITNNSEQKGAQLAKSLASNLYELRNDIIPKFHTIGDALEITKAYTEGPIVLADYADNPGGGAYGDSTYILEELIRNNFHDAALGVFWEPQAVEAAIKAGIDSTITIRLGGKSQWSGNKLLLQAKVLKIKKDFKQHFKNYTFTMGDTVALQLENNIDLVVNTLRRQVYSRDCFDNLGIDLFRKNIIVVKSSAHFRESFKEFKILTVATNGALDPLFYEHPERYTKIARPLWPFDTSYIKWSDIHEAAQKRCISYGDEHAQFFI